MSLTVVLTAYDAHFQHCAQTMDPNLFLKHVTLDHVIIGVVAFISIIYYLVPSLWGPVLITFCSVVLLFAWKRSREFWETWQESARKRQHAKREAHNSASTASTSPSSRPRRRSDKADSGDETLEASDSQP